MKAILFQLLITLIITSCSQKENERIKKSFFSLTKVNIAMIYEKKVNDIPCSLFNVTDTLKKDKKIGIIFKLDVKYDNLTGTDCCGIEPGLDGTKEKINEIRILFKNNTGEIDITNKLFNVEESQMLNTFEKYIQGQFHPNNFSCISYDEKGDELIENLKKEHLGGNLTKSKVGNNKRQIIENINDFIKIYNSLAGNKYEGTFNTQYLTSGWKLSNNYFYFWLPENFNSASERFDRLEIVIVLISGRRITYSRLLNNEV